MRTHLVLLAALAVGCAGGLRLEDGPESTGLDGGPPSCPGEGPCTPLGGSLCGDSAREPGPVPAREACDDGNLLAGDACDACSPTPFAVAAPSAGRELAYVTGPARASASDDAGDVLVAWLETSRESRLLRARRYSAHGVPSGAAIEVEALSALGDDLSIDVVGLESGWAVVWSGTRVDDDIAGVQFALVNDAGLVTSRAAVSTTMTVDIQRHARATRVGEAFIVVWQDVRLTGAGGSAIRFRGFTSAGAPLIPETSITGYSLNAAEPAVANRGGGWVAVWSEDDGPAARAIRAMRFDGPTPVDAVPVAVVTGLHLAEPAVAALDTGDYAIAILSPGTGLMASVRLAGVGPAAIDSDTFHSFGIDTMMIPRVRPTEPVIVGLAQGTWMVGARLEGAVRGAFIEAGPGVTLEPEAADLSALLADSDARGLSLVRGERDVWVLFSGTALGGLATPRGVVGYLLPVADACASITCDAGFSCDPGLVACVCDGSMGPCMCPTGEDLCSGVCADTQTHVLHCGACGTDCTALPQTTDEGCSAGVCTFGCEEEGWADCDADPSTGCEVLTKYDGTNCGGCGNVCAGGASCQDYECVCDTPGLTSCWPSCVDTNTDESNCGGCGIACGPQEECLGGMCECASGLTECSTMCVDLQTDLTHCGSCATDCSSLYKASDEACVAGECEFNCDGVAFDDCNTVAADGCETYLPTDDANCGACGNTCSSAGWCDGGVCQCPSGMTTCGADCVDLQADDDHCGLCGNACGVLEFCDSGVCKGT